MTEDLYGRLQDALAQLVHDFGPGVASEPTRIRSALSDLLSEESLALRGEIDAIVLAAEQGVPAALESSFDPAEESEDLVQRLTDQGATPDRAALAVRLWSSSLGVTSTNEALPPLVLEPTIPPDAVTSTDIPAAAATDLPADAGVAAGVGLAAAGTG